MDYNFLVIIYVLRTIFSINASRNADTKRGTLNARPYSIFNIIFKLFVVELHTIIFFIL